MGVNCFRVISGLFFLSTSLQAVTVEAFGDSLTHGFFAKTALAGSTPAYALGVVGDLVLFKITNDASYVDKYGGPQNAWPRIVADALTEAGASSPVNNLAVTGGSSKGLLAQVDKLKYTGAKDVRAFFFIGHNDLCPGLMESAETLAKKFVANYERALVKWDATHDGSTAYILPVGNVTEVYEVLSNYVWFESTNGEKYKCDTNWSIYFPYCPVYSELLKEGKLRQVLTPRIDLMNKQLEQLVHHFSKSTNRNRFFYLDKLHEAKFQSNLAAVDCFHLSAQGQKSLSEAVVKELKSLDSQL